MGQGLSHRHDTQMDGVLNVAKKPASTRKPKEPDADDKMRKMMGKGSKSSKGKGYGKGC